MKRTLALFLALLMALSLAACGGETGNVAEPTEAPAESPYADMESCAEYAIEQLKSVLKNPSSLIVNNLYAVEADDCYIFDIDYSAQNGLGGMNRDEFFLAVRSVENGFAFDTYGAGSFADAENQMYTSDFFDRYNKVSGSYIFNAETLKVQWIDESEIDPDIDQRVELTGRLIKQKSAESGYGGAWDFQVGSDPFYKVVYFADGTNPLQYEANMTISAIKDEYGDYSEAEIVEGTLRSAGEK